VGDRFNKKEFLTRSRGTGTNCAGFTWNTHVPQVIGAARRFELTGDARFHDVAEFFWYAVRTDADLCHGRKQQ